MVGRNLVDFVTCRKPYIFNPGKKSYRHRVVVYDYGVKFNILRCLSDADFKVEVVPAFTDPEKALEMNPDGALLSKTIYYLCKPPDYISGIMRTGTRFRMVLHRKRAYPGVLYTLYGVII